MNSWALLVAPLIIAGVLSQIVPAAELYLVEGYQIGAYYGAAFLLGVLLFRSSRKVKDHEFHRTKSIKKLRKAYKAEDQGLWTKADSAMAQLERDAEGYEARDKELVQGKQVSEIMREKLTGEVKEEDQEVHLFVDEDHVKKSMRRMAGEEDPTAPLTGATIEMMQEQGAGLFGNVSEKLAKMMEDDLDDRKKRKEKEQAPQPKPKPKPQPKQEPKPEPQTYGGDTGPAGFDDDDADLAALGASIGGGKSVGRETKICLDCGARNTLGSAACSNCGSSLT